MPECTDRTPPSFPTLLPSPFLTCFEILLISFGSKGLHLKRMIDCKAFIDDFLAQIFRGFLSSPQDICAQRPVSYYHHPYHYKESKIRKNILKTNPMHGQVRCCQIWGRRRKREDNYMTGP